MILYENIERVLNVDFLSNVTKLLSDTTEKVISKTGEFVENSKIKYNIYDAKNEVGKLCTEMGQKIYDGYRNDENVGEFIEEKCLEIDRLNEKIKKLEAELGD